MVSLVAAMGRNRVIGAGGRLPWKLPADMRRFVALTKGKPVVMGRKTFESIGKALPKRRNIVVSRSWKQPPQGVELARSVDEALQACAGTDEVMVIGGEAIYAAALPRAQRIYLSLVDDAPEGDAHFPRFDPEAWGVLESESVPADERNARAHTFYVLGREEKRPLPPELSRAARA